MSPVDFYYSPNSPPCMSVLLTGEVLGLKFNLKPIDTSAGETKTPEFLAFNPTHTIPTIVDDGLALWESRAIIGYLAEKYGKNDGLYPTSPKQRAKVDRLLHFDMGTLQASVGQYVAPVLFAGQKPNAEKLAKIEGNLAILDKFLDGTFFAAGNRITIADIALCVTVNLAETVGASLAKHPNVNRWYTRCKQQLPGYERVTKDCAAFIKLITKGKFRAV